MLARKHNAIKYHVVREAGSARILRVGKADGMTNLADLFTKVLTVDRRRVVMSTDYVLMERPGLLTVCMGEVTYLLERIRSVGFNHLPGRGR